jgi:thiol-disulfide isomerase/thioredoxin
MTAARAGRITTLGALATLGALGALGLAACSHAAAPESPSSRAPAGPPEKSVQVNAPGELVDIPAILPAGYVTVVDFWAESCSNCIPLGGRLAIGVAKEPRIVIRKIDVGDGFTPVARANKIDALPHFLIYDKQRRLRYDLVGADCLDATKFARLLAAE